MWRIDNSHLTEPDVSVYILRMSDQVISTRVDARVAETITRLAVRLKLTKKAVVEAAINRYAETMSRAGGSDVLDQTCGAWASKQSAADLSAQARRTFRSAMTRHRR